MFSVLYRVYNYTCNGWMNILSQTGAVELQTPSLLQLLHLFHLFHKFCFHYTNNVVSSVSYRCIAVMKVVFQSTAPLVQRSTVNSCGEMLDHHYYHPSLLTHVDKLVPLLFTHYYIVA